MHWSNSYKQAIHTHSHTLIIHALLLTANIAFIKTVVSGSLKHLGLLLIPSWKHLILLNNNSNMNYFFCLQIRHQLHHHNHHHVLSFWGMNFEGELQMYVPPSCLCKYLFICVWCVSENTMNVLRFILFFYLHQMLIWVIFHVETSLRYNLPFKGLKKKEKSKQTINRHNQGTLHGKLNNRLVMLVSAQVIPVELREQSDLPMFVSMTLPVATVTKLLWQQFAVCLQSLFSAVSPSFFSCICSTL